MHRSLFPCVLLLVSLELSAQNFVLLLDGDGDHVEVADTPALRLHDTDYTIEAWVFMSGRGTSFQNALLTKRGAGSENGWFTSIGNVNEILDKAFINISGGNDPSASATTSIVLDEWTHVAFVYSVADSKVKIYLNGTLDGEQGDFPTPNESTNANLFIGRDTQQQPYDFNGKLDEIRVWSLARSQEELQETLSKTLSGNEEGLLAYWNFDDQTPNDRTPNGNDGILRADATIVGDTGVPVAGETEAVGLPYDVRMEQNYPNPFSLSTTITFSLSLPGVVTLRVLDLLGREVDVLAAGTYPAGSHQVAWTATDIPSGVYLYSLESQYGNTRRTLILLQ